MASSPSLQMPATTSFLTPSPCFKAHQSATRRPRWASLAKSTLGMAVAVGALTAGQARALVVNVPGYGNWDVTFFAGSYGSNISKFATPPAPGVMPWWGSSTAAASFAAAVGSLLASPNFGNFGPYFAYGLSIEPFPSNEPVVDAYTYQTGTGNTIYTNGPQVGVFPYSWAQATAAPSSVPGPLPALGAAAAFGFSRKLRSRINASKGGKSKTKTV